METTIQQPPPEAEQEQAAEYPQRLAPVPSDKTPQEFYAEITMRTDVRAILAELACG